MMRAVVQVTRPETNTKGLSEAWGRKGWGRQRMGAGIHPTGLALDLVKLC